MMNDLASLPEALKGAMEEAGKVVEAGFRALPEPKADDLAKAVSYGFLGAGKRLRPFLVLHIASLGGAGAKEALPAALAIEMIHCYSLIHDDLPSMDDDMWRRGKLTVHKQFNEAVAILAGDYLLTRAFAVLADETSQTENHIRVDLANILSKGAMGMVSGQMQDMALEGRRPEAEMILKMMHHKTASLIETACLMGARLSGLSQKMGEYGRALGMAFQIRDDILDVTGQQEKTGKAAGQDHKRGKASLIDAVGLEKAQEMADDFALKAVATIEKMALKESSFLERLAFFAAKRDY